MSKSLIIAEKPSVASDLARALGVKKEGDHFESDRYVISSALGHLVETGLAERARCEAREVELRQSPDYPRRI